LIFPSLALDIATRHSCHGAEFGERLDPVNDAEEPKGQASDPRWRVARASVDRPRRRRSCATLPSRRVISTDATPPAAKRRCGIDSPPGQFGDPPGE